MHRPSPSSRLVTLIDMPWLRRLLRGAALVGLGLYFALGLLVLVLRYFVLPVVNDYRGDIERSLSEALARPVTIQAIDADWRRLWPNLHIHGLEIRDAEGRPALGFDEVEADIAWSSLWHLAPHFARLEINAPRLDLRRDAQGHFFVAGLELKPDETSGDSFADWLLAQDRIVIRDATITWHDELRQAAPLSLAHVNLDVRNSGQRHRFGLTADPPHELATRLDIRGDFRSDDIDVIETWHGQIYTELDYANLAGWRAWVDYPVELPYGNGGLRLWLDFEHKELTGATADVRLGRTALRLAPDLPTLDMERLDGRLTARHDDDGFSLQTRHLALATHDGIQIQPTDIDFRWYPATGTSPARGATSANAVDIGALAALAVHFPMAANTRARLVAYAPQGEVRDMRVAWSGDADALATYSVKGRFEDLGLRAQGAVPGFSGLDGRIDGNEKGGVLELATVGAALDLPAVFEQPTVSLAMLDASAEWKVLGDAIEVRLLKANFQNEDAAGEASGSYHVNGAGLGEIDLAAKLTRANGGAVWRYMPLVVGEDVRTWLHESIPGGAATATLRLKGDLNRFPFRDGSGIFEVKGLFHDATLRYAADWPTIEAINGDLQFVGARMTIRAPKATIWGVQLVDVKTEIADLDAPEVPMVITGSARGPTGDFLRFIEESPVGGHIDHVTEGMRATGGGDLRLRLEMPLRHIVDTRVDGRYRFVANDLVYDRDMPPLSEINGELHFTDDRLEAKKIRAAVLGAPMTLDMATENGHVVVQANGNISVAALRQQYGNPLFDHLAGSAPWSGTIRVKKRAAELRIESSLLGVSSSLPEPFNKTAGDVMPLVFERKAAPEPAPLLVKGKRPAMEKPAGERDQLEVSLGGTLRAQFVRRQEGATPIIEQGLISVGRSDASLPERGVLLAAKADRLDVDFWRRLANSGNSGNSGSVGLPISQIDLHAEELRGFGHSVHALQLTGGLEGDNWKVDIKSTEATGKLVWSSRENVDRLSARLSRLDLVEDTDTAASQTATETTERLPAIDLAVDHFLLHGRELGELRLQAENAAGVWSTQFSLKNEDGELDAAGRWKVPQAAVPASTNVDFTLKASDVERQLDRMGRPGVLRRGSATLSGGLSWAGAPTSFDYGSLSGKLALEAADGQFKKLEPGVGRLLGILSLQSLPRRISLDFRDIFSEGFAFDSITGLMMIDHGIMETSDFQIKGPAAKVLMNGNVNLVRETQDLKVRVQPALGETVATGVILINPVIGATAWVMNRIFGNPLDKVFAFDYAVTGSWADPKVDKVAAQGPGLIQQPPSGGTP